MLILKQKPCTDEESISTVTHQFLLSIAFIESLFNAILKCVIKPD